VKSGEKCANRTVKRTTCGGEVRRGEAGRSPHIIRVEIKSKKKTTVLGFEGREEKCHMGFRTQHRGKTLKLATCWGDAIVPKKKKRAQRVSGQETGFRKNSNTGGGRGKSGAQIQLQQKPGQKRGEGKRTECQWQMQSQWINEIRGQMRNNTGNNQWPKARG